MKTLIYGAGPIGQWMAAKFARAQKDVTLLARGATLRRLQEHGVRITDGFAGTTERASVRLVEALLPADRYDLVIVPMTKARRLEACPTLARAPHIESILFVGNDVAGPAGYLEHLPREKVLLGFPGAGGGWRDGELVIAEGDRAGAPGRIYFGELDGILRERTRRIETLFAASGFKASVESNIDGWLKYHFAFIGPMAGAIYKHRFDMKSVAKDKDTLHQFCAACREAGDILREVGYPRRQPFVFNLFYWLPRWFEPKVFGRLFGAPSAGIRFGLHATVVRPELLALADEFSGLQRRAGLSAPTLDALLNYLKDALEPETAAA